MNTPTLNSDQFLEQLEKLFNTFDYQSYPAKNMPRTDWELLVKAGILLPVIPRAYGGRESHEEMCYILQKASFYNLSLAMYIITSVLLFMRNVIRNGNERLKKEVIEDLQQNATLGGFAVLEPDVASGLFLMHTFFEKVEGGYHITGLKHWQCLSISADWWLIVAKNKQTGEAGDTFDFFVHKRSDGGFKTTQTYNPVGLRLIDFGVNELDLFVPDYRRLDIDNVGLPELFKFISTVWGQWAALGSGFLERIHHEAVQHISKRRTTTGFLQDIGYVQYRLGMIAAARNLCKALFRYVLHLTDIRDKITKDLFAVQSIKVLAADSMFNAALHYQVLCGAEGYRYNPPGNIAASALQDVMGFSILGGANDLLYAQLTKSFLDAHREQPPVTFFSLISNFEHTRRAAIYLEQYKQSLERIPDTNTEMVMAGKILARLFGITATLLYKDQLALSEKESMATILLCKSEIINIITSPDLFPA